jgi:hypothetical protein
LAAAELLSLGNDLYSGLVPHNGNICGLLLALEMLGCSSWLLGQEGKVPDCCGAGTDFLLASCSDSIAAIAAEGTISGTTTGANADVGAGDLA